jgi:HrpA-like RNA helicase
MERRATFRPRSRGHSSNFHKPSDFQSSRNSSFGKDSAGRDLEESLREESESTYEARDRYTRPRGRNYRQRGSYKGNGSEHYADNQRRPDDRSRDMRYKNPTSWRNSQSREELKLNMQFREQEYDPEQLPIHKKKHIILEQLLVSRVLVIQGDTGCGKSTQIPKIIHQKHPEKRIVITQPRRLGAISIGERVAKEIGSEIGDLVGYHIKGIRQYSRETKILFVTSGILIQELSSLKPDSKLPWDIFILDEVHERNIETEFLLVILKHMISKTSDHKLILMSATLNYELIANYFNEDDMKELGNSQIEEDDLKESESESEDEDNYWEQFKYKDARHNLPYNSGQRTQTKNRYEGALMENAAPVEKADGHFFEVKKCYLDEILNLINTHLSLEEPFHITHFSSTFSYDIQSKPDGVDMKFYPVACGIIGLIHEKAFFLETMKGSILVFLPGIQEINDMNDTILDTFPYSQDEFEVHLLHSSMPEEMHSAILRPPARDKRRIILSTNIAESSITLPDIRYVIDFGYSKELTYNSSSRTELLELQWAAKSNMEQRAGRAGRVADGVAFRLIPQNFFHTMINDYPKPEIQYCPIDKLILKVKQLGLGSPKTILGRAMQPPDIAEIIKAEKYLIEMGALHPKTKELTPLGKLYADMPCDIKFTRLCVMGFLMDCMQDCITIAACLSQEKPPFISYNNMPYRFSQNHYKNHQSRLKFDRYCYSDPLSYLSAFTSWYKMFGEKVERRVFNRSGERVKVSDNPTSQERAWCNENILDPRVLREILCTKKEMERRFRLLGFSDENIMRSSGWVKENNLVDFDQVFCIKLCIAGAFMSRYVTTQYKIVEEVNREKITRFAPNAKETSIIIPKLNTVITEEDLENIVRPAKEPASSITIRNNYGIISFTPDVNVRSIEMALWLGLHPQRYRNGQFVVVKKVNRAGTSGNLSEVERVEYPDKYINRIPRNCHKETILLYDQYDRRDEYGKLKTVEAIEVHCLSKPEFPYLLCYYDMYTRHEIHMDENSVVYSYYDVNPLTSDKHMAIAVDYHETRTKTIGRDVTLMPVIPLLHQILALLFNRNITFYSNYEKTRYESFKANPTCQAIYFDYLFTTQDIQEINEIRAEISIALSDSAYFSSNSGTLDIKHKIFELISKKRIPINHSYPDWRKIIDYPQPDLQVISIPYQNLENSVLPPLIALEIHEDLRLQQPNGYQLFIEELEIIRQKKQEYINFLNHTARMLEITEPVLACSECESEVCLIQNVENLGDGTFILHNTWGYVRMVNQVDNEVPYMNSVVAFWGTIPNQWAVCCNNHVIGWSDEGNCLISFESPVKILFPTLAKKRWREEMWNDDFLKIHELNEEYRQKRFKMKIDLVCKLCEVEMNREGDYIKHVLSDKKHKNRVSEFMQEYI